MQKDKRRLLDRLGDGDHGARGNALNDVICLPGTRADILQRIDDWIRETSSSERVLWIRGMAGRGKSTIASTVTHNWRSRASCAIFHFRRGQDALNARLVCALARQLGDSLVPEVKNAVLESVRQNEDIANHRLEEQFKTLLVASLAKLEGGTHPILIVVDALDECDDSHDVLDFVKLIKRHSASFPPNAKFLLTFRPEAALLRALEPTSWRRIDLDSALDVSNDLAQFIQHACRLIRDDHDLPENWPPDEDIARLVDMSQGLFQWARTAVTYISDGSPIDRLATLMRRPLMWSKLDGLYHQILSKAIEIMKQDPEKQRILRWVLGILAVAPFPLSLEDIAAFYKESEISREIEQGNVIQLLRKEILAGLNSLLHIPTSSVEPIRFMHTSIRDLLVSKQRCEEQPYYVDTAQYHEQLANLSFGVMLRQLKENICELSDLSKGISEIQDVAERAVSRELRYCCRAWSIHFTQGMRWSELSGDFTCGPLVEFGLFSKEKVLHWLEVMSLLGGTAEAITIARQIHHWLLVSSSDLP